MARPVSARGWTVTLAGLGINLALGVLYSWSAIAKTLSKPIAKGGWGWSSGQASVPYAIACGVFAVSMAFAGARAGSLRAEDRGFDRRCDVRPRHDHRELRHSGQRAARHAWLRAAHWSGDRPRLRLGHTCGGQVVLRAARVRSLALLLRASVWRASTSLRSRPRCWAPSKLQGAFRILGIAFLIVTVGLAQLLRNPPAGDVLDERTRPRGRRNGPRRSRTTTSGARCFAQSSSICCGSCTRSRRSPDS